MKKYTSLLIVAGCMTFAINTHASDGDTKAFKATKVCAPSVDIFNLDNVENLLGITDKKVAFFEVVLAAPNEVYKYSNVNGETYKSIMDKLKKHAVGGALLFIDDIKTTTGETIPAATFNLQLSYDNQENH